VVIGHWSENAKSIVIIGLKALMKKTKKEKNV